MRGDLICKQPGIYARIVYGYTFAYGPLAIAMSIGAEEERIPGIA